LPVEYTSDIAVIIEEEFFEIDIGVARDEGLFVPAEEDP
jgi:hypothetical protein